MEGWVLTNSSAIDRSKTDFYPTPPDVTVALMEYIGVNKGSVWECACGKGDMSKVLDNYFDHVISTDLFDGEYGESNVDFLKDITINSDWIITNPPFKRSKEFIEKAWETGRPFAFLLKSQYWHAKGRTQLFKDCKPSHVLALNWRPDFHFGKKGGSPTMECIWVVWDRVNDSCIYDVLERPKIKE